MGGGGRREMVVSVVQDGVRPFAHLINFLLALKECRIAESWG